MSRLSFAMYLINLSIIKITILSQQNAFMFGINDVIENTIYFFILSSFFSIPVVLLIEFPFMNPVLVLFCPKVWYDKIFYDSVI